MKIVYFGTPAIAAQILEYLCENGVEVLAIVTKVDKPRGRSGKPAFSPVKALALKNYPDTPLYQPERASTKEFEEELKKFDADLFVVFAYGEIIKQNLLDLPRLGCINLHPSLLPKYRGPAPIRFALLDGVKETGVSVIEMTLKMDAGDILAQEKIDVPQDKDYAWLEETLMTLGEEMILDVIQNYEERFKKRTLQDPDGVTFVKKITPEMAEIDWNKSATQIHNQIRAFSPKPGAWCKASVNGKEKRIKILNSTVSNEGPCYEKGKWVIGCGEGAISVLKLQLEGKKALNIEEFMKGLQKAPIL